MSYLILPGYLGSLSRGQVGELDRGRTYAPKFPAATRRDFTRNRGKRPKISRRAENLQNVRKGPKLSGATRRNRRLRCFSRAKFHASSSLARPPTHPAMQSIRLLLACGSTAHAMLMCASSRVSAPRAAAVRMDFGDSFYAGFDAWAAEYPQEDRDAYPELFKLPKDCYEVILEKPLGIAFEENEDGGVVVDYLVEGSNAEKDGTIKPGDVLLATTAAMSIGPKFERKLIPSRYLDFDTIMGAIGSNAPKFHKKRLNDVILQACARCHPTASSCIQLHSAASSCIRSALQLHTAVHCVHPPASNLLPPPSCLRLPASAFSCIQLHSAASSCIRAALQLHPAVHCACIQLPPPSCLQPPTSTLLPPPSCSLRAPVRRTTTMATRTREARAASTTTSRASSSRPTRPGARTEAEASQSWTSGARGPAEGGRRAWPEAVRTSMIRESVLKTRARNLRQSLAARVRSQPGRSTGTIDSSVEEARPRDDRSSHVEEARPGEVRLLVQGGGDRRLRRGQVQPAVALHSQRVQPRMPRRARTVD